MFFEEQSYLQPPGLDRFSDTDTNCQQTVTEAAYLLSSSLYVFDIDNESEYHLSNETADGTQLGVNKAWLGRDSSTQIQNLLTHSPEMEDLCQKI